MREKPVSGAVHGITATDRTSRLTRPIHIHVIALTILSGNPVTNKQTKPALGESDRHLQSSLVVSSALCACAPARRATQGTSTVGQRKSARNLSSFIVNAISGTPQLRLIGAILGTDRTKQSAQLYLQAIL